MHYTWRTTNVIVGMRLLAPLNGTCALEVRRAGLIGVAALDGCAAGAEGRSTIDASRDLTDQAQTRGSPLYKGNVTRATDAHFGVVARDWDASLRLMYAIEVIGERKVDAAGVELNQGGDLDCDRERAALAARGAWPANESAYCEFERYFEDDVAMAGGIPASRVQLLFVKAASPDAVLCHFRVYPSPDAGDALRGADVPGFDAGAARGAPTAYVLGVAGGSGMKLRPSLSGTCSATCGARRATRRRACTRAT